MRGTPADNIVGYVMDGYILCTACIDTKDEADAPPLFISDELADGSHCDKCLSPINESEDD